MKARTLRSDVFLHFHHALRLLPAQAVNGRKRVMAMQPKHACVGACHPVGRAIRQGT